MQKFFVPVLIVALFLALVWGAFFWDPAPDPPDSTGDVVLSKPPAGGDFTLQSYRGPVSLREMRGKVIALYFGYTKCPDICPTTLGYLSLALNELSPDERPQVQALFISVDPERDSLEGLRDYGEYFHTGILGITGTPEQVARVAEQYGAGYRKVEQDSAAAYSVDHSSDLYLIDTEGRLRESLPYGTTPARILELFRELIQQDAGAPLS